MRHALLSAAAVSLLLSAASCTSLPDSPVPAPMTDLQAGRLADEYLDDADVGERIITSIEPHGHGYFVSHKTDVDDADETSPRWYVVDVRHDGDMRMVDFEDRN
jgi:hypothetical protein